MRSTLRDSPGEPALSFGDAAKPVPTAPFLVLQNPVGLCLHCRALATMFLSLSVASRSFPRSYFKRKLYLKCVKQKQKQKIQGFLRDLVIRVFLICDIMLEDRMSPQESKGLWFPIISTFIHGLNLCSHSTGSDLTMSHDESLCPSRKKKKKQKNDRTVTKPAPSGQRNGGFSTAARLPRRRPGRRRRPNRQHRAHTWGRAGRGGVGLTQRRAQGHEPPSSAPAPTGCSVGGTSDSPPCS